MRRATAKVFELPQPEPDRGRLIDAAAIQQLIGGAHPPSLIWIYANVPKKRKLSHRCVRWFEEDVKAWLRGDPD